MENCEAFHYKISSRTDLVFLKRRSEILTHPNIYNIHNIYIYTLNDLVKEQLHISKVELIGENFFPLAEKLFHVYPIKLWLSKMLLVLLARSLASQKVRKGRVKYGLYCPLFYSCRPHHAFYTQGTSWAKNYKMLQLYFSLLPI